MPNGSEKLITFGDFARLTRQRGWTAEFLTEKFRGKIDEPSEFFHRVLKGKPGWDVAIPFRSVLELYHQERNPQGEPASGTCLCGCRKPVPEWKKYASTSCRQRGRRSRRSQTPKRGFAVR